MSAEEGPKMSGMMSRCASCGAKGGDDIKLKDCSACHLVQYCGVKCQKEHRKKHKRACKKRAAELYDEVLFRQTESSSSGDCPICFLPHAINNERTVIMPCCCKLICRGCDFANNKREFEERLDPKCPFCRQPTVNSKEEHFKRVMDRAAEKNDPIALSCIAMMYRDNGDEKSAFEYFSRAAKLGDMDSHYQLALAHHHGHGTEKDEKKEVYHYEQAAIGGQPKARHNLGRIEWERGRHERAIKHLIIAAQLGHDQSLENLKIFYQDGLVRKDDLAAALRGHQAAVGATKSSQREAADLFQSKFSSPTKM